MGSSFRMGSVAVGDEVLLGQGEGFGGLFLLTFGVFAEDVDFDVEGGAGGEGAEAGGGVGVGDDGDRRLRCRWMEATVRLMPSMVMEPWATT